MAKDLTVLKAIIKADYKRHIKKFNQLEKGKDIVFLGDSMVAYFPLEKFGIDQHIYNQGIPGDTTDGVLNRLDQVIALNPKKVILHIGLNDFVLTNNHTQDILNHLDKITEILRKHIPGVDISIVELTPINKSSFQHQMFVKYRNIDDGDDLNQKLKKLTQCRIIYLFDDLVDENHELKLEYTKDGIHLNEKGYRIYYDKIKHVIKE